MAGDVTFINGISMSGGGNTLLNQLLQELINQTNFMQDLTTLRAKALLTDTRAIGAQTKFSQISGPVELDPLTEGGTKTEQDRSKMPDKGFQIKEYGGKLTTTYLMSKWIQETTDLHAADPSVVQGRNDFLNNGSFLMKAAPINMAIDIINLLYKGFSITSTYGAGSPTPKGKALFATDHSVRNGTITFRNVLTTVNQSLAASSLQDALDIHKTQLRFDNGYRIKSPKNGYELWTSRANAVNARKILNAAGNQVNPLSGVGTNAEQVNQFSFDGNTVTIKEFELMGDTDKNGNLIGNDTMRFLVNPDTIAETRSLRLISLYDPMVKTYINNETDSYIADIRLGYAVDHYGAECGIVGSLGTV